MFGVTGPVQLFPSTTGPAPSQFRELWQRSVFRDDASRQFSDLHGDLQGQALSKKIAALADSMEPGVTRDLLNSFRICGSCKDFRRS